MFSCYGNLGFFKHLTAAFVLVTALTAPDCGENDLCDEASLVTYKKCLHVFAIAIFSGTDTVPLNILKAEPANSMVFCHLFVKDLEDVI